MRLGSRALRVLFDPSTQSCEEPGPLRMTISCEITNRLCITDIKITDRQADWRDLVCLCKCTRVRRIQGGTEEQQRIILALFTDRTSATRSSVRKYCPQVLVVATGP